MKKGRQDRIAETLTYANIAKGTVSFIVNCTFYCISAKYLSLQAKTFAPFLLLFRLYPLIEFAKLLPEPIGNIFSIDD